MINIEFRNLEREEIKVRVGNVCKNGAVNLLVFIQPPTVVKILDESVGNTGWKNEYINIDGNIYCNIYIWDSEKNQWISKSDVGTPSKAEAEKGTASDALKRAAAIWGIGAELKPIGMIYVQPDKVNITKYNGKDTCMDQFCVQDIKYDEKGNISAIGIYNMTKKVTAVIKQY